MVLDLATKADFIAFQQQILKKLEQMEPTLRNSSDRWMSPKEIAEETGHGYATVLNWIKTGKKDRFDKIHKLQAEEFSPGDFRVLRSNLIKFGKIKDCIAAAKKKKNAA